MPRLLAAVVAVVVLTGWLGAVAPPAAGGDDATVHDLIANLGSEDFPTRERAEQALDALGGPALEPLRAACRSPNPETARRARGLVFRIERRVDNEKTLAPTLVELTANEGRLADVLADLSKQSGYVVRLGGFNVEEIGQDRVTVKTGKVPFWAAVVALGDAADLQIGSVAGFVAPGSGQAAGPPVAPRPYSRTIRGGIPPAGTVTTIVLEPRGTRAKRPAAVHGAVLVEAFPVPAAAGVPTAAAALLQVWPEPKLSWQATSGVRIDRATDRTGQRLSAVRADTDAPLPRVFNGNNVVIVQNVKGGVVLVNPQAKVPLPATPAFSPNARQVVVLLKPGEQPADALKELAGAVRGITRSGNEALVSLTDLKPGIPSEGSHPAGVELKGTLSRTADGKWRAEVELSYDTASVRLDTGGTVVLRGRRGRAGVMNSVLAGLKVTDANGDAFELVPVAGSRPFQTNGTWVQSRFVLDLIPPGTATAGPTTVAFRGSYAKPVEVPFTLAGVPLAGGKR